MARWISIMLSWVLALGVYVPRNRAAQDGCPGAPPPRLAAGMQARVIVQGEGLDGLLRVRDQAGASHEVLVDMKNGDTFSVTGGPECADGYWWWNIVTGGGITGWAAEGTLENYFVEPLAEPAPNPLPSARDRLVARLGSGSAYSLAWSPDGQLLAIASSRGVWLYAPDLAAIQLLDGPSLSEVAWSPDGKRLAGAAADGTLPIWDVEARQVALSIPTHTGPVRAVSWSADGASLASASAEPVVRVWNATTGTPVAALDLPGEAQSVRWNPAINQLAASYAAGEEPANPQTAVQIWEGSAFTPIRQIDNDSDPQIRWSPDGTKLASFSIYQTISITTVADGTRNEFITNLGVGGDSNLGDFAWTPDGSFVLGSSYMSAASALTTIERGTSEGYGFIHYNISYQRSIQALAWRPGSRQLAVLDACFLSLLDGDTLTLIKEQADFTYPNVTWDQAGQPTLAEKAPGAKRLSIQLDTNQSLLSILDTATQQPLARITDDCFANSDFAYAFSPDESHIAVLCPYAYNIAVWDTATGQSSLSPLFFPDISCAPEGPYPTLCDVGWSATGRYITMTGYDYNRQNQLMVWDTQTGENVLYQAFNAMTPFWNADDRYFASFVSTSQLAIWDTATWQASTSPTVVESAPYEWRLTWSPDSSHLASAGDTSRNAVIIWDVPGAQSALELLGHTSTITALSWSPDSTRLASGDSGGTVRLWDAATGQLLLTLPGHQGQVWYFYWKPDGSQLAVVSEDRTARVWDLTALPGG